MKVKGNKGITLIALIITIIILLILAVVTIMAVNGDGIISKAKQAKAEYQNAQAEEQNILDKYLAEMEGLSSNNTLPGGEEQNPNISTYEDGVPIPVGFKYVEGTKDTGLVVENEADGSQFVWVPVETKVEAYGLGTTDWREPDVVIGDSGTDYDNDSTNLNIINNILNTSYSNSEEFLTALQEDFNLMANSVNNNHGFYVGRYETSLNNSTVQSVKGATSLNAETGNTWYGLYAYQKAYSTSSVQGSMIWGNQYEKMMTWLQNTGTDINSTIGDNRNTERTTGTKETDKINNVYDLYGNSFEWTLEAIYTIFRVTRGGICNDDDAPSFRNSYTPTYAYSLIGSRVSLYIK